MKICASLTTFPERSMKNQFVVDSLLKQSLKPDKIVVNLYKEEFKQIPDWLLKYDSLGLIEINYTDWNCKAYKKLLPTLQEYEN